MIRILELCTNLSALQLRLLHRDLGEELLSSLHGLSPSLEAFVAGPQHYQQEDDVVLRPLPCTAVEEVVRRMKVLHSLELNVWTERGNGSKWKGLPEEEPSSIRLLGIYSSLHDEVLEGLLRDSSQMEVLDIYAEKDVRVKPCVSSPTLSAFLCISADLPHFSQSSRSFTPIDGDDEKLTSRHQFYRAPRWLSVSHSWTPQQPHSRSFRRHYSPYLPTTRATLPLSQRHLSLHLPLPPYYRHP
jgi:hypothetical protein